MAASHRNPFREPHHSPRMAPAQLGQLAIASAGISTVVALLAITFTVLAYRAWHRRRNPALRAVALAFGLFAIKNVFSAINVIYHIVPHDGIELVLSLFDLALLLVLFLPFVRRRRS